MTELNEQLILDSLRQIQDPDLHKDIVTLGFIRDLKINGGNGTTGCGGVGIQTCLSIQIIAQQWWIIGGAIVDMPYDPSLLYPLMQRGLVH